MKDDQFGKRNPYMSGKKIRRNRICLAFMLFLLLLLLGLLRDHKTPPRPNQRHPLTCSAPQGLQRWRRNKLRSLLQPPEFDTTPPLYRQPSFHLPPLPLPPLRPSTAVPSYHQSGRSQGRHDGGVVDGCAAAAGALLLRAAVLARSGPAGRRLLDAGGEQGVRGGARGDRPGRAGQVGDGGDAAAQEDGRRRGGPLQGPGERRGLHRGRPRPLPSLRQLVPFLRRVHPGLGRRQRVQARVLPQARARRRAGAQEGHPVDRGGAQAVSEGSEEVRARGLAEHLAELRDEPHADAGGEPRAEVLHPAHHGGQGQQAPLQHPRHHHRQRARRRRRRPRQALVLGVAALRAHRRLGRPARRAAAARLRTVDDTRRQRRPPLRQREAGAPGLVHGRRGPRPGRLAPPADAMRPAVKGVPCRLITIVILGHARPYVPG